MRSTKKPRLVQKNRQRVRKISTYEHLTNIALKERISFKNPAELCKKLKIPYTTALKIETKRLIKDGYNRPNAIAYAERNLENAGYEKEIV